MINKKLNFNVFANKFMRCASEDLRLPRWVTEVQMLEELKIMFVWAIWELQSIGSAVVIVMPPRTPGRHIAFDS